MVIINLTDELVHDSVVHTHFACNEEILIPLYIYISLNFPAWLLVISTVAVGLSWQLIFNIISSLRYFKKHNVILIQNKQEK